jgi:predicted permease
VTLSLAVALAYLVLYSLQVLPSFSGTSTYSYLSTLPLSRGEVSLLTLLSVLRTFDSVALAAMASEVAMVAYLTESALATLAVALAVVANAVFGVAIAVWLSGVFQRNISRGGRGKGAAIARFAFLVSWGLAAASLGFLFNFVSDAVPTLNSAFTGTLASTAVPLVFSLIHPFSAGLLVAFLAFPSFSTASSVLGAASVLSFVSLAAYVGLAVLAARKTLSAVNRVAMGEGATVVRQRAKEFLLRLRNPIPAYMLKDVRVSSKSPSTAFIYAMPVLETLIIAATLTGVNSLRAYSVITGTSLGCLFTLISASVLLNTEGSGLDYTLSLPLNARVIVLAKSAIATVAYLPVPVAVGLLLLGRPDSIWLVLIPAIETVAISAATSAELSFFIQSYRKSGGRHTSRGIETRGLNLMSAGDLLRLAGALIVAGVLVIAPLGTYAGAYALTFDHGASLLAMALVSMGEFGAVQAYLRMT